MEDDFYGAKIKMVKIFAVFAKNLDYPKKSSVQNYSAEIATLVALLMPNMKTVN